MKFIFYICLLFTYINSTAQTINDSVYDINFMSDTQYFFLDSIVKNKEVIALGEICHGDGTTFIHKTEIVKYLHEKHGFNVILFESTFVPMELLNRNENNINNYDSIIDEIFGLWSKREETQDLFNYIKSKKIILSGFDCQYYSNKYKIQDSINANYKKELDSLGYKIFFINTLKIILDNYGTSRKLISENDKKEFLRIIDVLITSNITINHSYEEYWNQVLISIKGYALMCWEEETMKGYYIRDKYMANNLLWLINSRYKNEKVIVWAASEHIVTNYYKLSKKEYDKDSSNYFRMGDYLRPILKSKLFTISFIYNTGTTIWGGSKYKVNRTKISLENKLSEKYKYAFLLTNKISPITVNGIETHNKYAKNFAKWDNYFDAFYFMNEIKPSTRISKK